MKTLLLAAALAAIAPALPAPAVAAPSPAVRAETRQPHISIVTLGKGSPVVLVPGLACPRAVWDGFAATLARSHRVYLVQVNGFGGDAPGANLQPGLLDGIVSDLSAALARDHAGPVRFVGHSMGGLVGLKFAAAHPTQLKRLMVVDALPYFAVLLAPPGGEVPTFAQVEPVARMMRDKTAARFGQPLTVESIKADVDSLALKESSRDRMHRWAAAADPRVTGEALYEDLTTDLRPALSRIEAPVTVVVPWTEASFGKDRTLAFYARQYSGTPKLAFVGIGEAGHFVMLDQPEAFGAALANFVAD